VKLAMNKTKQNHKWSMSLPWVGALLFALAGSAQAQLATNISIDLRALSMGNAVTADPPGISAVHYNPAGLAKLDGRRIDYQFLSAIFSMESEFSAPPGFGVFGYSDDPVVCSDAPRDGVDRCSNFVKGKSEIEGVALYVPIMDEVVDLPPGPALAPMMAISFNKPGSKFTFANAMYAPLMAGFYRADDDPGNFLGKRMALERITLLSPSVGYQVNDELSVGLSVGLSYQAMAMETDFRAPNELLGMMRVIDEEICPPFKDESNIVIDLFLFGFCNAEQGIGLSIIWPP
jgi:long-subunit fatty acid transport protein